MAHSEKILKHKSVFQVKPFSHNPPGINDFHIIKPISKGAFGQVFLARRKDTKQIYAIKAMKKIDVLNKNMMEQVVVERDALAISSKSSYVVQLFYSFQDTKNLFLVMEYMIGGDLKSLLHNLGFFEEDMSKFYIAEVTLALDYLHNHSINHSDIKPDNMLLSASGHIKLTDFGLCTLPSENKPTVLDLVKHNTPCAKFSKPTKISNVYWRTPGQLQSLVSNFTFSSPKENIRSRGRFSNIGDKVCKTRMDFEFSTPGRRSCNSTPSGLQLRPNHFLKSSMYEMENVKKLTFANSDQEDFSVCKKRTLENMYVNDEKEDAMKRFRLSVPIELDTAYNAKENIPESTRKRSVVTFNTDSADEYNLSFTESSDADSVIENMSVDTTVSNGNNSTINNNNLSGVTILSETSMMSIGGNTTAESLNMANKSRSFMKDNVKWIQSSPKSLQDRDERFQTPIKNLSFGNDSEVTAVSTTSLDSTNDYIPTDNSLSISSDKSYNVFEMQTIKAQTPFRTPKSCTRGKIHITEKKKVRGTPDYLAPEILLEHGHGAPADFWALGVCFYEFVTGVPPFNDDTPDLVFDHILQHEIMWPEGDESLSEGTVECIKWLLSPDPVDRPCARDMKQLACFSNIKWDYLDGEQAPFIPQPDNIYDTTYFDAKNDARQFKLSDFKI